MIYIDILMLWSLGLQHCAVDGWEPPVWSNIGTHPPRMWCHDLEDNNVKHCHHEKLRPMYSFGLSQLNTPHSTLFLKTFFCDMMVLEVFGSGLAFKNF